MKRLILLVLLTLAGICSSAQEKSDILEKAKHNRVMLDYRYTVAGTPDVNVVGKAVVQQNCFKMESSFLLVLCDGVNVWTIDLEGKEAYIEQAGEMDLDKYARDVEISNGKIIGNYIEPSSGVFIPFEITNIEYRPASGDLSIFSPDENLFNGDWVITDLR